MADVMLCLSYRIKIALKGLGQVDLVEAGEHHKYNLGHTREEDCSSGVGLRGKDQSFIKEVPNEDATRNFGIDGRYDAFFVEWWVMGG